MSVGKRPHSFSTAEPVETCANGEAALKASGKDLMLAVGTGEGPLILSQSAWQRIAVQLGMANDAGTLGDLYTPFSTTTISAHFLTVPSLAVFQGITDSAWGGPCTELARARRVEWVLANQPTGACFQHCDASSGQPVTTHSYLELCGPRALAVISETSPLIRSLIVDTPPNPQVDGIIGASTLAGTRLHLDYPAQPQGRVLATCEDGSTRDACWAAPSCLAAGAPHLCFGQLFGQSPGGWAPVCP